MRALNCMRAMQKRTHKQTLCALKHHAVPLSGSQHAGECDHGLHQAVHRWPRFATCNAAVGCHSVQRAVGVATRRGKHMNACVCACVGPTNPKKEHSDTNPKHRAVRHGCSCPLTTPRPSANVFNTAPWDTPTAGSLNHTVALQV
jgi:hypothetical protein